MLAYTKACDQDRDLVGIVGWKRVGADDEAFGGMDIAAVVTHCCRQVYTRGCIEQSILEYINLI